jgi:hypothetical protein
MEHVSGVTLLEDEFIILALLARALRKNKATKSMCMTDQRIQTPNLE